MDSKITKYKRQVSACLRKAGAPSASALNPLVTALAIALYDMESAMEERLRLESIVYEETTAYGVKIVQHPLSTTLDKKIDRVLNLCKVLGLTAKEVVTDVQEDPMVRLTADVLAAQKRNAGATVFPE